MKISISYPIHPVGINQLYGAQRAYYEAKFGQNGHPGIDFTATHGQPVMAAHDGEALYIKDDHGGEGIHVLNKQMGIKTIYWHLVGDTDASYKPPIPMDNGWHPVTKGELIGYADNTGYPYESTGTHLHFGLQLVDANGQVINTDNGMLGCVNPLPYFDGNIAAPVAPQTVQIAPGATPAIISVPDTVQADLAISAAALKEAPTPQNVSIIQKILSFISQMLKGGK